MGGGIEAGVHGGIGDGTALEDLPEGPLKLVQGQIAFQGNAGLLRKQVGQTAGRQAQGICVFLNGVFVTVAVFQDVQQSPDPVVHGRGRVGLQNAVEGLDKCVISIRVKGLDHGLCRGEEGLDFRFSENAIGLSFHKPAQPEGKGGMWGPIPWSDGFYGPRESCGGRFG